LSLKGKIKALRDVVDERDRLYKERDESRKTAVDAALQAAKEKTSDAFIASEKAIVKAEDAQREYNARSNEFRGQLDDQAKTLLPRNEADARFKAIEASIEAIRNEKRTQSNFNLSQWMAAAGIVVLVLVDLHSKGVI
jgi:hypothetical protein